MALGAVRSKKSLEQYEPDNQKSHNELLDYKSEGYSKTEIWGRIRIGTMSKTGTYNAYFP